MSMVEDKYKYSLEEELRQVVLKFERMERNKEKYFFDVFEFESLIDYYIENINSVRAFQFRSGGQGFYLIRAGPLKHSAFLKSRKILSPAIMRYSLQRVLHSECLETYRVQRKLSITP